ncbi:hypothetical protein NC653_012442 [Populus alba x Populus x berolinensis]|uniref:Uncharacterized protein n=1 Tax=Populus alba x Populus x berolinensis TaxID=444605 RepID=A0AAD6R544_9ROSI|nr:hypothetical protein NC653_012442 [Populus alba x Populus x berolinensis]
MDWEVVKGNESTNIPDHMETPITANYTEDNKLGQGSGMQQ